MRRLYRSIYVILLVSLIATVACVILFFQIFPDMGPMGQRGYDLDQIPPALVGSLSDRDQSEAQIRQTLLQLSEELGADVSLFENNGQRLANSGPPLPLGQANGAEHMQGMGFGRLRSFVLSDNRILIVRFVSHMGGSAWRFGLILLAIAVLIAVISYPFVRGLTGRIERLQLGVETLGRGDLDTRVIVEGEDEVAQLAISFNRAAERIQALVASQRLLLANTSHELRTPLSRLRLALTLFEDTGDARYTHAIRKDLIELEELIESLLTTSRVEALHQIEAPEKIDLLALCAEEASHFEQVEVTGESAEVMGDAKLLRRLIRNILDNAQVHGQPPVHVQITSLQNAAQIDVSDQGQGIAAGESEKIFEPFHRARRDTPGTGLGLALVRRIARLHGGEATYLPVSAQQKSCFRISLPFAHRQRAIEL